MYRVFLEVTLNNFSLKLQKWLTVPLFFKVFNVNAPLPPRKEQEIKESPYSPGYNQSFTTASTQTPPQCQLPTIHVEQTVLPQEPGKIFACEI